MHLKLGFLFVMSQDFLCQIERCCKQYHLITPITFPPEHPVEEVGRLLLCCLLKHQDLGNLEIPHVVGGDVVFFSVRFHKMLLTES